MLDVKEMYLAAINGPKLILIYALPVIIQIQPVWIVQEIINLIIHAITVLMDTIDIKIYQTNKLFVKYV
jgi:hypothetical protein